MPVTDGTRPWRTRLGVALVVVGLLGAGLLWWADASGGDDEFARAGSELVEDRVTTLLEAGLAPSSYRIDYRVEGLGGGDPVVTSDRLWVRRPFEARLETFDGSVPEGPPSSVQISALGTFGADGADAGEVVVAAPPGPPTSDTRIASALADALDDGRIALRERREVLGRTCQVIRSAALLASGDLAPAGDDRNYADTCIDDRGLVLEELLVSEGEPLLRRVAIDLEVDPDLDGVSFETGEPTVPVDTGGGFVAETEPDSRSPGRFFESDVPEGFTRLGRFVVIPPQHENFSDITRRPHRLTYVSDVFVDGSSVVVLDQGGTLGNVDPFPGARGVEVDLGGRGTGLLTYGRGGPVILVPRDDGKFLRARGTVRPQVLEALLEGLREVDGGELVLLDPSG